MSNRFASRTRVAIEDIHGQKAEVSPIRDLNVNNPYRVVGTAFVGSTIDANFWTSAVSGAGAANTQSTGLLSTASGTANSGYAQMRSVRKGRFIFAHPMVFRMAGRVTAATVALNTRRWGVFSTTAAPTPTDGFYFEQSAAGVLSVVVANGGTPTSVASGSFNGEAITYTLDTNVHAFEIHYFVMSVKFYIDQVLLHTFVPTTTQLAGDFTLPICWNSVNGAAGVTSGVFECWATVIRRLGRDLTQPLVGRQVGTGTLILKRGAGALHSINLSAISNNAIVTLYDNTAASGTVVWASGPLSANALPFDTDLRVVSFDIGLTVDITAANATAAVIYE